MRVPPLPTDYYAVLHQIELIYERTRAPVSVPELRAALPAHDHQFGAWLTKFMQRSLIVRSGNGVVPNWSEQKHFGTCETVVATRTIARIDG